MIKRSIMIFFVIAGFVLTLGGCWDLREVEELSIIHGMAIDTTQNGGVRVIFQVINTAAESKIGGGRSLLFDKAYGNRVIEADSLYAAIRQLPLETVTQRFFAHTEVVIVSEEFARNRGFREILDYLERTPQIRPSMWILVGRGDLVSIMDTPEHLSPIPTRRISDMLRHPERVSSYAALRLGDFTKILQSKGAQPFTALIETCPSLSFSEESENGILGGEVPEPANLVVINGTAVFKEDNMIGWLDQQESRGLLWLLGKIKYGKIQFPIPGSEGHTMATEILTAKSTVRPAVKNGHVVMMVKIIASTSAEEVTTSVPLDKSADIKRLEEAQNQAVIREVRAALAKAQQQYQVDVFGFGEAIHRHYPAQWQQMKDSWPDIFPGVEVQLVVKTSIHHTNLISRSLDIE
ncbi:MAG: Ger(x)C family spore germination protein [Syntrophomonadaceae bacterium]|jgi:spore germination protein KC